MTDPKLPRRRRLMEWILALMAAGLAASLDAEAPNTGTRNIKFERLSALSDCFAPR